MHILHIVKIVQQVSQCLVCYIHSSLNVSTQNTGKERENSYRKLKRSPAEKEHTNTRKLTQNVLTITDVFLNHKSKYM
jgi:hypothetical protein